MGAGLCRGTQAALAPGPCCRHVRLRTGSACSSQPFQTSSKLIFQMRVLMSAVKAGGGEVADPQSPRGIILYRPLCFMQPLASNLSHVDTRELNRDAAGPYKGMQGYFNRSHLLDLVFLIPSWKPYFMFEFPQLF